MPRPLRAEALSGQRLHHGEAVAGLLRQNRQRGEAQAGCVVFPSGATLAPAASAFVAGPAAPASAPAGRRLGHCGEFEILETALPNFLLV